MHGWTLDERIVGGSVQVMVVLVVARLAGVIRPWSARWRATWSSPAAARMTASLAVQHAADVIIVLDLDGA